MAPSVLYPLEAEMSYPQPGGPNMAGRFGAGGWGDQRAESRGAAASVLRASELAEQSKMASGGTDGRTEERREETDRRLVIAFSADAAGPREVGKSCLPSLWCAGELS